MPAWSYLYQCVKPPANVGVKAKTKPFPVEWTRNGTFKSSLLDDLQGSICKGLHSLTRHLWMHTEAKSTFTATLSPVFESTQLGSTRFECWDCEQRLTTRTDTHWTRSSWTTDNLYIAPMVCHGLSENSAPNPLGSSWLGMSTAHGPYMGHFDSLSVDMFIL